MTDLLTPASVAPGAQPPAGAQPSPAAAGPSPTWRRRASAVALEERRRFGGLHQQRSEWVLQAPLDELYEVPRVGVEAPRQARIPASVQCASCGEPTMETRVRRPDGRQLCLPCFDAELAGTVRVLSPSSTADRPATEEPT